MALKVINCLFIFILVDARVVVDFHSQRLVQTPTSHYVLRFYMDAMNHLHRERPQLVQYIIKSRNKFSE